MKCLDCGIDKKSRKGDYCKKCGYNHRDLSKVIENNKLHYRGAFVKGHTVNVGRVFTKAHRKNLSQSKLDIKNPKWKGDKAGYIAFHIWLYRRKGKAIICSECGSIENVQWSNESGLYLRDVNDWKERCKRCHDRHDLLLEGAAVTRFPELRRSYL